MALWPWTKAAFQKHLERRAEEEKAKPKAETKPDEPPWWDDLERHAPFLVPFKPLALAGCAESKIDPYEKLWPMNYPRWVELAEEYYRLHYRIKALRAAGLLDDPPPGVR